MHESLGSKNNNENQPPAFKEFQQRLMKAATKEEVKSITKELLLVSGDRYRGVREFALEGNSDISERLKFLLHWSAGHVLDVGSYDGYFLLELEKSGLKVDGTDMMEEAIDLFHATKSHYPQSKAEIVVSFSESLPHDSESYDTVIMSHTLEHVFDPVVSLKECLRVAKTGGRIIVIVPHNLGNDPTHVRVVTEAWLLQTLAPHSIICKQEVGNGLAIIAEKVKI